MLPDHLLATAPGSTHGVLLFNDELHSFDQVINVLQKAQPACTKADAQTFATRIDQLNLCLVAVASLAQCEKIANTIGSIGLNTEIVPLAEGNWLYFRESAVALTLSWLADLARLHNDLRLIINASLLEDKSGQSVPHHFLHSLMATHYSQSKTVKAVFESFFFQLMVQAEFKYHFSVSFLHLYPEYVTGIALQVMKRNSSLLSLGVQIFTIRPLVVRLMNEHDLFGVILGSILEIIETSRWHQNPEEVRGETDQAYLEVLTRAILETLNPVQALAIYNVITDFNLICELPETLSFLASHPENSSNLLTLYAALQDIDPYVRKTGEHVLTERSVWDAAVPLQSIILESAVAIANADAETVTRPFFTLAREFTREELMHDPGALDPAVSFFLPLQRVLAFWAASLIEAGDRPQSLFQLEDFPTFLLPGVLRIFRARAQIYGGMWSRNGYSPLNYLANYHSSLMATFVDPDVFLCQLAVVVMGPVPFLTLVSNAFQIPALFQDPENVKSEALAMVSGFISLVIWILCDRTHAGDLSKEENTADQLRYVLVNLLLTKRNGMTHSFIKSRTPTRLRVLLESALEEVGVYRAPSAAQQSAGKGGAYTANAQFLHLYDPFFTRLYRDDAEKAAETMQEMRKDKAFLPPTRPIPLKPACAPVLGLLGTDWLKTFILNGLRWTVAHIQSQNTHIPKLIHDLLYLLQLDLTFNPEAPAFLSWTAESRSTSTALLTLVHKIYSQTELKQEKQAAEWLLRSYAACEPKAKVVLLELGLDLQSEAGAAPRAGANRQRQEEMLRMFKAQQAAFAAASGFEDLSDEDEAVAEEKDVCILCHEEKLNGKMMALACVELTNLLPQVDPGVSVRLCGHCVHLDCVKAHFVGLMKQRSFRFFESELCRLNLLEFLCPLCKAFTNSCLPVTWEADEAAAGFVSKLAAVGKAPSTTAVFHAAAYTTALTEYRARTPGNTLLFDQRNLRLVRLLLRSAAESQVPSGEPLPSQFHNWLAAYLANPATPPSLVPYLLDLLLQALKHNEARPGPEDEPLPEFAGLVPQLQGAGFPPLEMISRAFVARYLTPLLRVAALVLAANGRSPPFLPEAEVLQFSVLLTFLDITLAQLASRLPAALSTFLPQPTTDLSWRPFALIPLPDEFEHLLLKYYSSMCTNCNQRPKDPGLCLRCGVVVCLHGCQTNNSYEATRHSASCGLGNGVFLSYTTGSTILVHRNWGAIYSSLYLNQHGEVCSFSPNLKERVLGRHSRLTLNQARYDLLTLLYLNQNIPTTLASAQIHGDYF